ncbi:fumarylacetoacetate hydrolase family protein [Dactylonectria estremocensis]|uniref:Fumarylacetoacetate hydrolase family protein n=1 Tax=Dactylonectria estremocensis TaxID=1079267 RepID=A0A9P9IER9_9HYPO|nr:fumarylacetoacetate hydrolase family protein [Dactylonectria estremocensis]
MAFSRLICFQIAGGEEVFFADLGADGSAPEDNRQLMAFKSFGDLVARKNGSVVSVGKLLAPLPQPQLPIYCVGLNYKSHAEECKSSNTYRLSISKSPPLWCKPAAALAGPGETIALNAFQASSWPDYEGELVFVSSREVKDVTVEEASNAIAGFTIGNDLSCRKFQMPGEGGGQFFFAKAFDKFAPMGPVLVSPDLFRGPENGRITTSVNGELLQDAHHKTDAIWSCAEILSFMSNGTTIPAGTAVMTGTPAGIGLLKKPPKFLKDGDVIDIEISGIGKLTNKIVFR